MLGPAMHRASLIHFLAGLFSDFRTVWNELQADYTSGVTDMSVKMNYAFQFSL